MTKFSDQAPNEIYAVSTHVRGPQKIQILISVYIRSLYTFVIGSFDKAKPTRNRLQ